MEKYMATAMVLSLLFFLFSVGFIKRDRLPDIFIGIAIFFASCAMILLIIRIFLGV